MTIKCAKRSDDPDFVLDKIQDNKLGKLVVDLDDATGEELNALVEKLSVVALKKQKKKKTSTSTIGKVSQVKDIKKMDESGGGGGDDLLAEGLNNVTSSIDMMLSSPATAASADGHQDYEEHDEDQGQDDDNLNSTDSLDSHQLEAYALAENKYQLEGGYHDDGDHDDHNMETYHEYGDQNNGHHEGQSDAETEEDDENEDKSQQNDEEEHDHDQNEAEVEVDTDILISVTNLPKTEEDFEENQNQLLELFQKFGEVFNSEFDKVEGTGLVKMNIDKGIKAITELDGYEIKGLKIRVQAYYEKKVKTPSTNDNAGGTSTTKTKTTESNKDPAPEPAQMRRDRAGTFKLFTNGLPNKSHPKNVIKFFEPFGRVVYCELFYNRTCAFIFMEDEVAGEKAIAELHGKPVEEGGKLLNVSKSENQDPPADLVTVKLSVKNVPDTVSAKEIVELFSPYGSVVNCRVFGNSATVSLEVVANIRSAINELNEYEIGGSKLEVKAILAHEEGDEKFKEKDGDSAVRKRQKKEKLPPTATTPSPVKAKGGKGGKKAGGGRGGGFNEGGWGRPSQGPPWGAGPPMRGFRGGRGIGGPPRGRGGPPPPFRRPEFGHDYYNDPYYGGGYEEYDYYNSEYYDQGYGPGPGYEFGPGPGPRTRFTNLGGGYSVGGGNQRNYSSGGGRGGRSNSRGSSQASDPDQRGGLKRVGGGKSKPNKRQREAAKLRGWPHSAHYVEKRSQKAAADSANTSKESETDGGDVAVPSPEKGDAAMDDAVVKEMETDVPVLETRDQMKRSAQESQASEYAKLMTQFYQDA